VSGANRDVAVLRKLHGPGAVSFALTAHCLLFTAYGSPRSGPQTYHSSGFFRAYPESLVRLRYAFFIARMADPDEAAIVKKRPAAAGQERLNWLRSLAASMGILALSSFGAVVIFDWYFFSVVDGIAADLRPVVGAFHPVGHARSSQSLRAKQPDSPAKPPDPSEHHISARLVPVRTTINPKTLGN
jgi:hypothetical protein